MHCLAECSFSWVLALRLQTGEFAEASAFWGTVRKDACEACRSKILRRCRRTSYGQVDIIFCNPRRGTRYTVEKVRILRQ